MLVITNDLSPYTRDSMENLTRLRLDLVHLKGLKIHPHRGAYRVREYFTLQAIKKKALLNRLWSWDYTKRAAV